MKNDLVFNMMRAWQGGIGVSSTNGMVSPAYIVASPKIELDGKFINHLIRSKNIIDQIDNLSYGVTDFRKRLYWDSFILVELDIPSYFEQKKIGYFFGKFDSLITLHQRNNLFRLYSDKCIY